MTGFIPEITTTIKTTIDTDNLDDAIKSFDTTPLISQVFGDLETYCKRLKDELEQVKDPVSEAVADNLSSYQSQIISMKHYKTGMMMNSVDISHDGDGVYLVGNTATSVDGFPYPLAIEKGTRAHRVAPITYNALHFIDKGVEKWSKGHMVSGIRPDPYVQPSIDNTLRKIEEIVNNEIRRIN